MDQEHAAIIAPENPGPETIKALVLKVSDGDGFHTRFKAHDLIGGPNGQAEMEVEVRCGFIDAPELDQPGGREAKNFLTSLIGAQSVELVVLTKMDTGRSVDRHGRLVCVPYITQEYPVSELRTPSDQLHRAEMFGNTLFVTRNVELEMILNGWAWVLERYQPDERYLMALEQARRHKRGIWAREGNLRPWEFKRRKYRASLPNPTLNLSQPGGCPLEGCGGHLVKRTGKFGAFFGCSNYPGCKHSRSATT